MARGALTTVLSVGLSTGVFVFSFFGCFTDLRKDSGKCQPADAGPGDCTIPKCNADGTPATIPVPNAEKRVCFRGENEGMCVDGECALTCETQMVPCKCASDTACPDDKQCVDWACVMGECKSTLTTDGTLVDTLEVGDCKKSVCQAGMPQTVADGLDKPADVPKDCFEPVCTGDTPDKAPLTTDVPDGTGCTSYMCGADGTIMPTNSPVGLPCMIMGGMAGVCDPAGMCVDCLPKADWDTCKMNQGTCAVPKCIGQPCTANEDCKDACADGVCCNNACTDECKSCAVTGKVGTCTNIPYYQEDTAYGNGLTCDVAVAGSVCDGTGNCLRKVNVACDQPTQCISNVCTAMKCVGKTGELCSANNQCVSGMCAMGVCK